MLPDRVSNPGPLTYESGALPIAPRGPAVEWLEWLSYRAGSRLKVESPRLGFAIRRLENSVNPALNGTFFESGMDAPSICCVQNTV